MPSALYVVMSVDGVSMIDESGKDDKDRLLQVFRRIDTGY